MKKGISLFFLILLLSVTTQSLAQVKFGVRAGLNLANMAVKDFDDNKMRTGFHIGGIVEYSLVESIGIEAGLLLSEKGVKYESTESEMGITVSAKGSASPLYLEIPVNAMYKYNLENGKILLFAGPYFGYGIAGKIKSEFTASGLPSGVTLGSFGFENTSEDIKFGTSDDSDIKATDFGLNIGAGFEIKNLQIRAQYGLGLNNLDPDSDSDFDTKNRVIGFSLGYMFGGK
ncbi:MAG: hypothetical protein C0397_13620 [Odoribacter sp.]|nr:hypothetical protein [Odoribacter sp.]